MPPPMPRKVRLVAPPKPSSEEDDEEDEEQALPKSYLSSHLATLRQPQNDNRNRTNAHEKMINELEHNPQISSSQSSSGATALTHLQTNWPGRTDHGQHLEVRPMSFHELLRDQTYQIVIPLFQRRYCWTTVQIQKWYEDVTSGQGLGQTHKTMFKKHVEKEEEENNDGDDGGDLKLICIDGQQRTTTVTLFLVVLRALSRTQNLETLVSKIDALLFQNPDALAGMKRWAKYQVFRMTRARDNNEKGSAWKMPEFEVGWLPSFHTMLVPSYIDRAAYYEILCHDFILEALEKATAAPQVEGQNDVSQNHIVLEFNSSCQESVQYQAFIIFATELARTTMTSAYLNKLFRTQVDHFSIMYIELLTNDNLQQIFLWMQEKSIFGMGRLLHNPNPGIDFTPIDLARNLVVSSAMDRGLSGQMEFYLRCWVIPLEQRFGGPDNLSRILYHWVNRIDQETDSVGKPSAVSNGVNEQNQRYVGDMETKLYWYKESVPPALQEAFGKDAPMMVYARFHSIVQHRALSLCGDPNAITEKVADSIVQDMVQEGETMGL